ncbi:DUF3833 family protein [Glacieibacterium megasporae]|uniref:DUF3833 family protein n=1 Tax=Glacieibacterium megasporae TaxID=2835787 RepID=UPI001C1DEB21|nr:DUF3833 family protein [Polymorphobacter megasporae]UAJ12330.1 DUF3833 domain-containing protein [Polymorphobacter megasporae]
MTRYQAPVPTFDPIAFFAGPTQGHGSLAVAFSGSKPTLVEGHGVVEADGSLRLEQTVRVGDKAATRRTWHLYRVAAGRYSGTLSDAKGPVSGDGTGNQLHLSFAMRGGLQAEQFLYLQPGGQVARNRMVIRKLGVPVASLDETIFRRPS